ncbi:MAG: hypothetical protein H7327_06315 [Herminiimonas sp.]|nr:hypothetical protein [Herminiimonas sp.]
MVISKLNWSYLERRARFIMGAAALVAVVLGLTFKTGLVSTMATYERQSWYLVSEHDGFVVSSQVDDEAACRKRESAAAVCRSGESLVDQHGGTARR